MKIERKEREYQRRVNDIMDAAIEVFDKKGYFGATIDEIAEKAGYAKASLYYYFKSKEEIFKKMIFLSIDSMLENIDKIIKEELTPEKTLIRIIEYFLMLNADQNRFFRVYYHIRPFIDENLSDEEKLEAKHKMDIITEKIESVIDKGYSQRVFRYDSKQGTGLILMGMLSGIIYHSPNFIANGLGLERITETTIQIIINGLKNG